MEKSEPAAISRHGRLSGSAGQDTAGSTTREPVPGERRRNDAEGCHPGQPSASPPSRSPSRTLAYGLRGLAVRPVLLRSPPSEEGVRPLDEVPSRVRVDFPSLLLPVL